MAQIMKADYTEIVSEQQSDAIQFEELSIESVKGDGEDCVSVSLGYRRCKDFDEGNQPGQDFASVRGDKHYIVGVVADGVSQSFYGNLAATYLSQFLLGYLWDKRSFPPSEFQLENALKEEERKFSLEVVDTYSIPEHLNEYIKKALTLSRAKGSQTVFASFILDLQSRQLCLYQVGDIQAIVHSVEGASEQIESPPEGRWSSAGTSELSLKVSQRSKIGGFLLKSDGVSEEWGKCLDDANINREVFKSMVQERSSLDDVSTIIVRFDGVRRSQGRRSAYVARAGYVNPSSSRPDKSIKQQPTYVKKVEDSPLIRTDSPLSPIQYGDHQTQLSVIQPLSPDRSRFRTYAPLLTSFIVGILAATLYFKIISPSLISRTEAEAVLKGTGDSSKITKQSGNEDAVDTAAKGTNQDKTTRVSDSEHTNAARPITETKRKTVDRISDARPAGKTATKKNTKRKEEASKAQVKKPENKNKTAGDKSTSNKNEVVKKEEASQAPVLTPENKNKKAENKPPSNKNEALKKPPDKEK